MNNEQLYVAMGVPLAGMILSVVVNVTLYVHLSSRMDALSTRIDARFMRLEEKMDTLTGKVIDVDNRLIRLEEHSR